MDPGLDQIDTLLHWRHAVSHADLERSVVGVVGDSSHGGGPLAATVGLLLH